MTKSSSVFIPQNDPKAGYLAQRPEIDSAVRQVLQNGWYLCGSETGQFERAFADYIGVRHAIGVGNGTDALVLALRACNAGPGTLVFTVSHTAVATVAAIEMAGATPVLVDIDSSTYTLSPESLESAIKDYHRIGIPKVVIPVHLYGHPADMYAIVDIARRYGMRVIEDCAQSHGALYRGRRTGSLGDIAAFSFYPTKNLGALGDGGMVVTDDDELSEKVRLLHQYGWRERYISEYPGMNSRLDELQAAILSVKLRNLDSDNDARSRIASIYESCLVDTDLVLPCLNTDVTHVFHQYVIQTVDRNALRSHLYQAGIGCLVHYPVPVHLQPAYRNRVPLADSLANSVSVAQRVLSLPLYPQLIDAQIRFVSAEVVDYLNSRSRPV